MTAPSAPKATPSGPAAELPDGDCPRCPCGCAQVWSDRHHMWLCIHCDNVFQLRYYVGGHNVFQLPANTEKGFR